MPPEKKQLVRDELHIPVTSSAAPSKGIRHGGTGSPCRKSQKCAQKRAADRRRTRPKVSQEGVVWVSDLPPRARPQLSRAHYPSLCRFCHCRRVVCTVLRCRWFISICVSCFFCVFVTADVWDAPFCGAVGLFSSTPSTTKPQQQGRRARHAPPPSCNRHAVCTCATRSKIRSPIVPKVHIHQKILSTEVTSTSNSRFGEMPPLQNRICVRSLHT